MRCISDLRQRQHILGMSLCRSLVLASYCVFLLTVVGTGTMAVADTNKASQTSSSVEVGDLPADAVFLYKWSDSRDVGVSSQITNNGNGQVDPIGYRLAIPEFWQASLLEEEDGYSVFYSGEDTTGAEVPPVKMLLGIYLAVKQDYSDLGAMTETYRDTTIASQTLLYAFEDNLSGHAYQYYQVKYPHQHSGKMVEEFAFFIETKRLIYRLSFITPERQSERNELFVWSIFNSLRLYDEALK